MAKSALGNHLILSLMVAMVGIVAVSFVFITSVVNEIGSQVIQQAAIAQEGNVTNLTNATSPVENVTSAENMTDGTKAVKREM